MSKPSGPGQRRKLIVAIDGPSSSGKSTVGAEVARRLGYRFCDTGLLYRAVAWLADQRHIPPTGSPSLVVLTDEVQLIGDRSGRLRRVMAGGREVTNEVCSPEVDRIVSDYARVPELRAALVPRQRELAVDGGIVMAGRDIGTVILPDADAKIFLYASPEERARRRAQQRQMDQGDGRAVGILDDLKRRDTIDSSRETAPLKSADDAIVLSTDGNTFDQTVALVLGILKSLERGDVPNEASLGR